MKTSLPINIIDADKVVVFSQKNGRSGVAWSNSGLYYASTNDQSWEFIDDNPLISSDNVGLTTNSLVINKDIPHIVYEYKNRLWYVTYDGGWSVPIAVTPSISGKIEDWALTLYSGSPYVAYVKKGSLFMTDFSDTASLSIDQSNNYNLQIIQLGTEIYCHWIISTAAGSEIQRSIFNAIGNSFGSVTTISGTETIWEIAEFKFSGHR